MIVGSDLDTLFVGGNIMFDLYGTYSICDMSFASYHVVKPNIRTGEGRRVKLRTGSFTQGDYKKKIHRKMAKKSRRGNRR